MAGMPSAASAATTALNSYGSAMRENETWQYSLEGRMAAFQAQFEITASSMINSHWVKWFYDAGRAVFQFLGMFDGLVGRLVLFPPTAAAVIHVMGQLAATKMASGLKEFFRTWGNTIASLPESLSAYGTAIMKVQELHGSNAAQMGQLIQENKA